MVSSKNPTLQQQHDLLLHHIILPRFLPQQKSSNFHQTEIRLMHEMVQNVYGLSKKIPTQTVNMFVSFYNIHYQSIPNQSTVSTEINALKPGRSFAMFVRRQNCMFVIHAPPQRENAVNTTPQEVIVATFPGNLHPDEVYAHDSDIEFNYPVQSIKVKFSKMMRSEDFAHQLCFMYGNLPIEAKNRNYVSKWLMTLLTDESSEACTAADFPIITKKMRDEILGQSKKDHFRRSSFYMGIKALLQYNLTIQLGSEQGKLVYKIVMINFLIQLCGFYSKPECTTFNIDLLAEMIAKMARRIEKLRCLMEKTTNSTANEDFYRTTVVKAKITIRQIRAKIDKQIDSKIATKTTLSPLIDLNFEKDIIQKMTKLAEYLKRRSAEDDANKSSVQQKSNEKYQIQSYDRKTLSSNDLLGKRVRWMEFENKVLYHMTMDNQCCSADDLRSVSLQYASFAESKYSGNQLFMSRMILVRLKLLSMLDHLATQKHPLLLQHQSGVNPNIIQSLLLPQRTDMKIAHELEQYFLQRNRNASATAPSLSGEDAASNYSFSVKYAQQNADMISVRRTILAADANNLAEKKAEWLRGRKRAESLRDKAQRLSHEYYQYTDKYDIVRNEHSSYCEKCRLEREAAGIKVDQYERLLPEDVIMQHAIVFELRIPKEIAFLRDTLYGFTKFCSRTSNSFDIKFKWNTDRTEISQHNQSSSEYVWLGSERKSRLESHHVDFTFDTFDVENTSNCIFYVNGSSQLPKPYPDNAVKDACRFQTQDEYTGLDWTLESTVHTQNQVLSLQSKCPQELSLSEYINFGSLRADGHRLQLRKLYGMIETEALSFEKESVLSLILQTLWELGESGNAGEVRESHIDFADPNFCMEIIKLLKKFMDQQKSNWKHPFKMLMAVLLAVRVFEINADALVAVQIVKFLNSVRFIALDWIDKIGSAIHGLENPDEKIERELRLKLIYVGIAGALTFFVHPKHEHFEQIFTTKFDDEFDHDDKTNNMTAPRFWLQFIVTVKNNILMYTSNEESLPSNLRMFLRLIESIGVNLEPSITMIVKKNPNATVNGLICKLWTRADGAAFPSIEFHSKYPQILMVETILGPDTQTVTIDIIAGIFLVDGLPVCRLPLNIMQTNEYRCFFSDVAFEVQPDGQKNYSTVQKYNGCSYEFKMTAARTVLITERTADGVVKELVHWNNLHNDFSYLLVKDYSHWWNKSSRRIEFRRKTLGQKHFSKERTIDYELDLQTKLLIEMKTKRCMLDVCSGSYRNIVRQLERLENFNHIHILMDDPRHAKVELVRMNLKFKVEATVNAQQKYELESNEFSGMQVSRQQNVGTLFGLNHGLVLESSSDEKNRVLLIPHGNVQCRRTDAHVSVDIETQNELRTPPFFQYQVDSFCQQIKSNNRSFTAWFYLAYLHAITSHGENDQFTRMSGTERAIEILQSAYVWSSAPYEPDTVKILQEIAKLSPIRVINQNRQSVQWPGHIQPRAAQDCFVFIVKQLFEDSQRLYGLHFKEKPDVFPATQSSIKAMLRDHYRCQPFNPNLRVSDTFIENKVLRTSLPNQKGPSFSEQTQKVAILYHRQQYNAPSALNLTSHLKSRLQLTGMAGKALLPNILDHSLYYDYFHDLWIRLYDAARKQEFTREQFALILTVCAHRCENIDLILALQAVATNSHAFIDINPPNVDKYDLSHGTYSAQKVTDSLKQYYSVPEDYYSEKWKKNGQREAHDTRYSQVLNAATARVTRSWPCDSVDLTGIWAFFDIDFAKASRAINSMLLIWNNNRRLDIFFGEVKQRLNSLPASGLSIKPPCLMFGACAAKKWSKSRVDFDVGVREQLNGFNIETINLAKDEWCMGNEAILTANHWWSILQQILNSDKTNHLIDAGLFPRIIPSVLLPKIMISTAAMDTRLKAVIGAWAMAIAREQRQHRILSYSKRPELKAAMDREIENEPHVNWKPCERPEWLLFEIEQNLTIRQIQVKVAARMIDPPSMGEASYAKHSVMQLNMGEGKTAVIVPILAAVLADGKQTCQITVLKSLYATNLNSLRQYLGGMLNRRIYTFPCRRDMPIAGHIHQLADIYEECKTKKGVILTLPEYRLSFQLKMYESIQKGDHKMANGILNVLKAIDKDVRSILDESDAILQPKYQLIYTVGNQSSPDGGELRWTVVQAVLKNIPGHMKRLWDEYGKEKIEFDDKYIANGHVFGAPMVNYRSDVFTPCRILDETMFERLKTALIDDFLCGRFDIEFPEIIAAKKIGLRSLLTHKGLDSTAFQAMDGFQLKEQNIIMILSGLLRFEVLKLILTKRWRVNYGVDENGRRKMAIPFRAKDVAAEMTEFGHPDVAICFTQLSYYYSGLSDQQLLKVFSILENTPDPVAKYEEWIQNIEPQLIDPSVKSYTGVNLDDPQQRDTILFPLLRFNMHTIDFWLSNAVFPHEMKIFENKLTCTAWDLCSDHLKHLVTGFSGTNDTKNILPLPIAQNDLQELENTNENMRKVLLRPENRSYEGLPANVSGIEILKRLIKREIPVLLDSGALMLELNNKQVAEEWLKLTSFKQFDAAVYFDKHDILQTVDRNGVVVAYDCSVYRDNLSRCLVYLDDVHTRGTDLKFPLKWKASVTLSGDITRDKTVQTCMRMRQLGKTQSISFWASYEADVRIRRLCNLSPQNPVENEHVIKFICANSRHYETANMAHWAAAGLNYTKKLIGHKLFENSSEGNSMENLYRWCVDEEFVELMKMYGEKEEALLLQIIQIKLNRFALKPQMTVETQLFVAFVNLNMIQKMAKQAPNLKQFTHSLDEEQEKELENELEEQREVQRPSESLAAVPSFDKRLEQLVLHGVQDILIQTMKTDGVLMSMANSLSHTQLFQFIGVNANAWAEHLLVTKDFKTVIVSKTPTCDEFLRPVWWIAYIRNPGMGGAENIAILMSSYECNRLKPAFQKSKVSTLFMYRARLSKFHSNLMEIPALQLNGSTENLTQMNIHDEIQIGVYAGMMYFKTEAESEEYCKFLGLIPRPRTKLFEHAFEIGVILSKGFVSPANRLRYVQIHECIGQCQFQENPVNLIIRMIEANHQSLPKAAHVASILIRGIKPDMA